MMRGVGEATIRVGRNPPSPTWNFAGSTVMESLPRPHPDPFWTPSHPSSPFPLGKLLGGLQKPSQAALPAPGTRLDKSLQGDKEHILP